MMLFCALLLLLPAGGFGAQRSILPDTLCLRYRFLPGDTLIYRVEAQDSILIGQRAPLWRERYELLWLICDSVGSDGTYWLRLIPTEFLAQERMDTLRSMRPESPCERRPTILQLDSLGRRLEAHSPEGASRVCPGGAFQLPFLIPLAEQCIRLHESWLLQDSLELWENGTPAPRFLRTALLRRFPSVDTLGFRCTAIEYVTTGTGWFVRDSLLSARAVVNAFGRFLLAAEGIPVWAYVTQEIRLALSLEGREQHGLHYLNLWYRLQERRTNLRQSSSPAVPSVPHPARKSRR
ncbi:hypothetical protein HRbin21_01347 [bacterium HR21]|jgi:hypothetical protein|nr:hypothetical protein HRbin21_01347 [bacterium HR21]